MPYQHLHTAEIYLGSQQHFKSSQVLCQTSGIITSFFCIQKNLCILPQLCSFFLLFLTICLFHFYPDAQTSRSTLCQGTMRISLTVTIHFDDVLYNETLLVSAQNAPF